MREPKTSPQILPCETVKDMIQLYFNKYTSCETKNLISEHLKHCESCKKYYKEALYKPQKKLQKVEISTPDFQNLAKRLKKKRYMKNTIVAFSLLTAVGVVLYKEFVED